MEIVFFYKKRRGSGIKSYSTIDGKRRTIRAGELELLNYFQPVGKFTETEDFRILTYQLTQQLANK